MPVVVRCGRRHDLRRSARELAVEVRGGGQAGDAREPASRYTAENGGPSGSDLQLIQCPRSRWVIIDM